jgi:hypothetical protein
LPRTLEKRRGEEMEEKSEEGEGVLRPMVLLLPLGVEGASGAPPPPPETDGEDKERSQTDTVLYVGKDPS